MKKEPSTENLSPLLRRPPLFMALGSLYGLGASRFYPQSHGHWGTPADTRSQRIGSICLQPLAAKRCFFSSGRVYVGRPKMEEHNFLSSMPVTWREEEVASHMCGIIN